MAGRRDALLQQMGITQYRLHRPRVLQGEVAVRLKPETRLVVVTADSLSLAQRFLLDVLHSLNLVEHQVMVLPARQLAMLPTPLPCAVWLLGIDADRQYAEIQLATPPLTDLIDNSAEKRALWQQITTYDSHFSSHP